jgi:hypothetical protein
VPIKGMDGLGIKQLDARVIFTASELSDGECIGAIEDGLFLSIRHDFSIGEHQQFLTDTVSFFQIVANEEGNPL